jgi:hypothetical protein
MVRHHQMVQKSNKPLHGFVKCTLKNIPMAYYNIMIISAIQNGHEEMFNHMQRALMQDQVCVTHIMIGIAAATVTSMSDVMAC